MNSDFSIKRRTVLEALLSLAATPGIAAVAGAAEQAPPQAGTSGRRIIVFDVNETLLDIGALRPQFTRVFGSAEVLQEWFSTVLLYSQVTTIAGPYADFGSIARASLKMTADARGVALADADGNEIIRGLASLPAHSDVRDGLDTLRAAGFRLVTLTNSPPAVVGQQLKNAGIDGYFERQFSVDAVRRFKPAPEVYRAVATDLGVPPSQLRLVAAHAWDVWGAMRAGCSAAFIARPGKALFPSAEKPDIVGNDLRAVAAHIVRADGQK